MQHALALPCAFLIIVASVPAAALRKKGPMPTSWSPEFVNCNRPGEKLGPGEPNLVKYQSVFGSCGTSLPYMYISTVVAPMVNMYEEQQATIGNSERLPLIVSIGTGNFGEYGWYRQLLSDLDRNGDKPYRVILVEPIEELFQLAKDNSAKLPEKSDNVRLVQAAIFEDCAEETVKFYSIHPKLWEDFDLPNLYDKGLGCSSADQSKVAPCTIFHIRQYETTYSLEENQIATMDSYVRENVVKCLTPAGLLEEVGAQAADVNFLLADTAGTGKSIVNGFLKQGAEPTYLSFERDGAELPKEQNQEDGLVSTLKGKQYRVGIHCEGDCGQAPYFVKDVVAVSCKVLPSPLLSHILPAPILQAVEGVVSRVKGLLKATIRSAWRKHSRN